MAQVRIVTDSGAYLPDPVLITRYRIEVIPMLVQVGNRTYPEQINRTDETFFRRMAQDKDSVAVKPPTLSQVQTTFERLGQSTDSVICIHTSKALHDVADVVERAARSFMGRQRIIVIDSLTTSIGLGLIVEAAAKAASNGASQIEIIKIVRSMIPRIYALFMSDSLSYLEAWGRLSPAQTLLGTMLGLRPISTMEDGDLIPIEKTRNYSFAIDKFHNFIIEFSHIKQLYIVQHDFNAEAAQLLERLEASYPNRDFPVIGYSPSLAVHIGPRALGIMVYEGTP
ncbi:MAG: DegV family protein [Anaerolineae bacterium]